MDFDQFMDKYLQFYEMGWLFMTHSLKTIYRHFPEDDHEIPTFHYIVAMQESKKAVVDFVDDIYSTVIDTSLMEDHFEILYHNNLMSADEFLKELATWGLVCEIRSIQ